MVTSGSTLLQASPIARMLMRFLRWWGRELSALVPGWLQIWHTRGDQLVLLEIEEEQLRIERFSGGQREHLLAVELDREAPIVQGAEIKRRLALSIGADVTLFLSLSPTLVLRRTLTLPQATEENLGQTLAFELDRYTPFKPDQAYYDFCIRSRDESSNQIKVELAVARRADVEPLLRVVTSLGLHIQGLAFAGEILGGGRPIDSYVANESGLPRRNGKWRIGFGLIAVALLTALLAIPIWQKRSAAISLLAPLAEAKMAAQQTDVLRERLGKLADEYNVLPDKKWATPSLLIILDELSKRLKDDTYISNFNFDGKTITLQGESGSASELVEMLEATPLFHKVAFRSPLTKLPGTAFDRFYIGFELRPEGLPKPPAILAEDKQ